MKIEGHFNDINSIDSNLIQLCQNGHWYSCKRTITVETDKDYTVATFNVFERMLRTALSLFCVDYFKKVFHSKKITIISPNSLSKNVPPPPPPGGSPPKPPAGSPPNPKNSSFEKTLERTISWGLFGKTDLAEYKKLDPAFQAYKADLAFQVSSFGNHAVDHTIIDVSDFGNAHGLGSTGLQKFMRYLVMTDQIFGYIRARSGYSLYHKDPGVIHHDDIKAVLFTKAHLKSIDSLMSIIPFPTEKDFPDDDPAFVNKVVEIAKDGVYHRKADNLPQTVIGITGETFSSGKAKKAMDNITRYGTIHSWNYTSTGFNLVIKLYDTDALEPGVNYGFKEWRNFDVIDDERNFQKDNRIEIKDPTFGKGLSATQKTKLESLLKDLNARVKNGVYKWSDGDQSILDLLKNDKYIHDYKRIGFHNDFEVYVKPVDSV